MSVTSLNHVMMMKTPNLFKGTNNSQSYQLPAAFIGFILRNALKINIFFHLNLFFYCKFLKSTNFCLRPGL